MKYHFKIHAESSGYWADCLELKGCISQADTREELEVNLEEALNLYLSEPLNSKHIFPKPIGNLEGKNIIGVLVHPSVGFANRLREFRIKCKLTQHQMKDRLGFKYLSSYQRLEDPKRANPELRTMYLIKKSFPKFKFEDIFLV
ncbi:MAG: type II toxin-antitoxin system HicB family antitoxin [Bacteriovoracaceae bacterium]|nr:type II toxin-antitoxin system HicB family antitoxin [Bacteriovoracaceae bacterium]